MRLVTMKLFIVRTILCATVHTYTTITITIIACLLSFSAYKLFISNNTCSLFFSHNYSPFCSHPLQRVAKQQHLFVILLTQLFAILHTPFAKGSKATTLVRSICIAQIFKPRPQSSNAMRLHTRLTELLLTVVCFILPFYMRTSSVG